MRVLLLNNCFLWFQRECWTTEVALLQPGSRSQGFLLPGLGRAGTSGNTVTVTQAHGGDFILYVKRAFHFSDTVTSRGDITAGCRDF